MGKIPSVGFWTKTRSSKRIFWQHWHLASKRKKEQSFGEELVIPFARTKQHKKPHATDNRVHYVGGRGGTPDYTLWSTRTTNQWVASWIGSHVCNETKRKEVVEKEEKADLQEPVSAPLSSFILCSLSDAFQQWYSILIGLHSLLCQTFWTHSSIFCWTSSWQVI